MFQSTRLREARLNKKLGNQIIHKFQSTRLREARHDTVVDVIRVSIVSIHAPA